jgi:hypothetical protein
MKRAATLLGIAATALSLNATTQDFAPRFAAAEMLPTFASASIASTDSQKPDTTTAWVFALGFLGLVVLRRTRSGPLS